MSSNSDQWVDLTNSQITAIRNDVLEECAAALELEATHNDAVARDEKDFLPTRAKAEHTAHIKRYCAKLIRAMKK